jgi:radical SAM protein with 4Fe4S-binding SPASM domain
MIRNITIAGQQHPAIGVKMLISSLNKGDALFAAPAALDLGVRYLQLKFLGAPQEYVLPADQIEETSAALTAQLSTLNRDGLSVEFLPPFAGDLTSEPCLMTYLHPVVDWDGTIYICPFFEHRKITHSIGNIHDGGFFRWWNDRSHKQVFAGIDPMTCIPNCPMKRYNPVAKFIQIEAFRLPYI